MKKLFLSFVMLLATAVSALALPTTDVNVVIDGDHGSSTIMLPFDYDDIPEGLHVYLFQGWDDDANAPILEEVYGFEKNTPYYITTDYEDGFEETFTGVRDAEYATYSYSYNGEDMCTGVYAPVEITDGWVLRVDEDGQWGFSKVRADEPFTVPANQVYFYKGPEGDDDEHDITYPAASWIGSWDIVSSAEVGSTVTATANFEVEGYHVESFTVNDGAVAVTQISNTKYSFVMPDEDVTIVAPFAINKYTVRFYEDDTKATEYPELSQEVDYNGHVIRPAADPTKSAHNFLYWAADGVEFDFENFTIEMNTDIYATWEAVPAAKWTDSEGNEVTSLMANAPYFSYVAEYPTITLHLEGAVYGEDGQPLADDIYNFGHSIDGVVYPSGYVVSGGQVNMDVNFHLIPNGKVEDTEPFTLFDGTPIPAINYLYTQYARDNEERTPLWEETQWSFVGFPENMQLGVDTDPEAGEEFVLGNLGEFGGDYQALQVNADKLTDGAGVMIAKQITFENRSAGKMTVTFSRPNDGADLFLNIDGDKWAEAYRVEMEEFEGNIELPDFEYGSANTDEVTVTFYVNPGVHTIRGHYSYIGADDPGADPEDEEAVVSVEGSDGETYEMSAAEYHSAQDIRVYSMHFEPFKYEMSVNSTYSWASIYHENDLIVPTEAEFVFYSAPSCDGNNVTLDTFTPKDQIGYEQAEEADKAKVIPANTALVFRDNNGGGDYVFYRAAIPVEELEMGEWIAGPWDWQPKYDPFEATNIFLGKIEDTPCDPMRYYVMGSETTPEIAIFQKYNGYTLGAHKVYLDLNGAAASVRLVLPGNYNPIVTGVEQNAVDMKPSKFLMDGKVIITRGARMYNVQGMNLR